MQKLYIILLSVFAIIPICLVAYLSHTMGIETQTMTRDIAAIANLHPLAGFLSNFGMIVWSISAAIIFFTLKLLKEYLQLNERRFLKHFGVLTAYMGLDDFFQLHEVIGPEYLHVPEKLMLLGLIIFAMFVCIKYRKILIGEHVMVFILALLLLGGSVIYDNLWFEPPFGHWNFLFEDAMKWLGICAWCGYSILKCKSYWESTLSEIYFSRANNMK